MTWELEQEEKKSGLIPWKGRQLVLPSSATPEQRKGFGKTALQFWRWLRGYTADDITRLKEAGVRQVEAKAAKDFAEAEAKIANAAKAHAEADKARAEGEAIRIKAACDLLQAKLDAAERVEVAISRIKQKGGTLAFSEEELRRIVLQAGKRFPDEAAFKDPEKQIQAGENLKLGS